MHMNKFFSALLLLAIFHQCHAQGFKKGYIITIQGDTLQGFIEDGSYEALSYSINFKIDKKGKDITTYNPSEIKAFRFFDGDFFIGEMVHFSALTKDGNMDNIAEIRFLHRLYLNSKTSLFELNDERAKPMFLRKSDGTFHLLCIELRDATAYLEVLSNELQDCPSLKIPANMQLNSQEIQKLLVAYDHCGETPKTTNLPQKMVWAGISFPLETLNHHYLSLGNTLQFEYRPINEGIIGNITLGAELLYAHTDKIEHRGDRTDKYEFKHLELGIKTRFYANDGGWFRPYIFLAGTYYKSRNDYFYKFPLQEFQFDYPNRKINKIMVRPGVGIHAQWKRHFLRFELPLDGQTQPRLGYGFAF